MKNILLALDLQPADRLLLDQAVLLAGAFHAKLWLVHVAAPDPEFVGFETGPVYIRESRAKELREEHQQLQQILEELRSRSIETEALLIQGPTVGMLEKEVEKLQIDLLVMGSHRHGFFYETFVGHTSSKLIKHLSIPVLIVPLPNES